jgi:SPP1 gp7 family putative phage head morphogenesis protein
VIEAKYRARLERMVEQMAAATERSINQLYRAPGAPAGHVAMDASFTSMAARLLRELGRRFTGLFTGNAGGLADYLAKGIQVSSAKQLGDSLKHVSGGVTLKTDVASGAVAEVTKAAIKQNVALIKSIPAKYFEQIESAVMRSIQTGKGLKDLQPEIQKIGKVSKDRAALIARDQTAKATTAINKARMSGLGIRKFEWLHSAGEKHPRELHITPAPAGLNHGIFEIDNPPIIDERTGERGLPGQLINCKCRMVPVISFEATETTPK